MKTIDPDIGPMELALLLDDAVTTVLAALRPFVDKHLRVMYDTKQIHVSIKNDRGRQMEAHEVLEVWREEVLPFARSGHMAEFEAVLFAQEEDEFLCMMVMELLSVANWQFAPEPKPKRRRSWWNPFSR